MIEITDKGFFSKYAPAFSRMLTDKTQRSVLFEAMDIYVELLSSGKLSAHYNMPLGLPSPCNTRYNTRDAQKNCIGDINRFKREIANKAWQALPKVLLQYGNASKKDPNEVQLAPLSHFFEKEAINGLWLLWVLWSNLPKQLPLDYRYKVRSELKEAILSMPHSAHKLLADGLNNLPNTTWTTVKANKKEYEELRSVVRTYNLDAHKITRCGPEGSSLEQARKIPVHVLGSILTRKVAEGIHVYTTVKIEGVAQPVLLQTTVTDTESVREYDNKLACLKEDQIANDWIRANWSAMPAAVQKRLKGK